MVSVSRQKGMGIWPQSRQIWKALDVPPIGESKQLFCHFGSFKLRSAIPETKNPDADDTEVKHFSKVI
jgi:hypothetical protein